MFDLEGRDGDTANLKRLPFFILNEGEFEAFGCGGIRIKRLGGLDEARLDSLGPSHDYGPRALADKLRVEQEPWQAAKVVPVQMSDEHGIDVARLKSQPAHADKSRDAAIDQKGR